MAKIDSLTLKTGGKFMQAFGDVARYGGKVALAANPAVADVIRLCRIPAGVEVSSVLVSNDALDSNGSKTLAVSIGFEPVNAADGPSANATYFAAAGQTVLQTANEGKVFARFDGIKFEQDVYLTMTVGAASATFAAGSIWARATGAAIGIK